MIGARLAHFEILAKLGEGGMGEVWRARDTRVEREVAINIAGIYEVGEASFAGSPAGCRRARDPTGRESRRRSRESGGRQAARPADLHGERDVDLLLGDKVDQDVFSPGGDIVDLTVFIVADR